MLYNSPWGGCESVSTTSALLYLWNAIFRAITYFKLSSWQGSSYVVVKVGKLLLRGSYYKLTNCPFFLFLFHFTCDRSSDALQFSWPCCTSPSLDIWWHQSHFSGPWTFKLCGDLITLWASIGNCVFIVNRSLCVCPVHMLNIDFQTWFTPAGFTLSHLYRI